MKNTYRIFFIVLFISYSVIGLSQEKPKFNLSLVNRENIEFEALKSFIYLIRQDYIITSSDGEIVKLGGNDFFGRGFGIGILAKDRDIWFPGNVRKPWEMDKNFDEYRTSYKPRCTFIKIKKIQDTETDYKVFDIQDFDSSQNILSIPFGFIGIQKVNEPITNGSLMIFHSSHPVPEKFEDLSYSTIYLEDLEWENNLAVNIRVPYLGDKQILGGGFFQRIISEGMIQWKLAGIYAKVNGEWKINLIQ